jgi:hypothetical protein
VSRAKKEAASFTKPLLFLLLTLLVGKDRQIHTLITGAMRSGHIPNATFWIDLFGLIWWQQAGNFLQDGIQELIFWDGLDDFALTENDTLPFSACQTNIGVSRLAGPIYHTAHDGNVNGSLHLC